MSKTYGNVVWKDRKRTIFGLPLSFTRYILTERKLIIDTGFLNRVEDDIWLYRITDLTLKRSFGERLNGVGTIHCCSMDKTKPEFDLLHIKDSQRVKEMLAEMIDAERTAHRVGVREYIDSDDDSEPCDTDPDDDLNDDQDCDCEDCE